MNNSINRYKKINIESDLEENNLHVIIQKMMQTVIDRSSIAKGLIKRNNIIEKSKAISSTIDILYGLISGLDFRQGKEIAKDLHRLYEYMIKRLYEANMRNDISILDEVIKLMSNVKSGWDMIPEEVKTNYNQVAKESKK